MGMRINELVVELTRRCNVKCRHCLRGTAQAVDISKATIDKLLEGVDSICTVTFSGGEPSLAADKMAYFLKVLKARKISIEGFYVITNGKKPSLPMVHALMDLYAYASSWEKKDYCSLIISGDQYHTEVIGSTKEARDLYEALSFFRPDERKEPITRVIAEGRATKWGHVPADRNELIIGRARSGEIKHDEGVIYINALGDLIPSCNVSYKTQEKIKIGNVNDKPIPDILRQYIDPDKDEMMEETIPDELQEAA